MPKKGSRYAQPILHFYCRPCGEYHHKEHPHYEEMKRRKAKRQKAKQVANSASVGAIVLCLAFFSVSVAMAEEHQHPYFPLRLGDTWTYQYPPSANDPDQHNTETRKVVEADPADNTYAVEHTVRLSTLPAGTFGLIYEIRGGYILNMGKTPSRADIALGDTQATLFAPAPIILKPHLIKGMRWKDGPPNNTRACEVLDFVTVKVPAGEYRDAAKVRVKLSFISHETGRETYVPTTDEYYAPNVGLVKVDLVHKDGSTERFLELTSFSEGGAKGR
jgi:hypothetical protein